MRIVIPGKPIPKARPRMVLRDGKTRAYDPQWQEKYAVRAQFIKAMRRALSSENREIAIEASNLAKARVFEMVVWFYLPLNDSDSEAQKNAKLWGFEPCNHKPDCTNMLKFYEDAANEVLYPDDCMIVSGSFKKEYAEIPRTEIEIMSKEVLKPIEKAESILKIFGPDKMKDFLNDIFLIFLGCSPEQFDRLTGLAKTDWLTNAACALSAFAIKYSDDLRKVRKYDGLIEEVRQAQKGMMNGGDDDVRRSKTGGQDSTLL